jgi:hypothetical protein
VFYVGFVTSLSISMVTSVAVTCQVAWPSVIAVLPLLESRAEAAPLLWACYSETQTDPLHG